MHYLLYITLGNLTLTKIIMMPLKRFHVQLSRHLGHTAIATIIIIFITM